MIETDLKETSYCIPVLIRVKFNICEYGNVTIEDSEDSKYIYSILNSIDHPIIKKILGGK